MKLVTAMVFEPWLVIEPGTSLTWSQPSTTSPGYGEGCVTCWY